jgi:acyl-CoA thioester hydrolase
MLTQHDLEIRVRYQETDGQGRLHHANYLTYFEAGRTELLRAAGYTYRDVEAQGIYLVVAEMACRYYLPAQYDDLLTLRTTTVRAKGARIEHEYRLSRGDDLLAEGRSIVACVDRDGRVRRLPEWLVLKSE